MEVCNFPLELIGFFAQPASVFPACVREKRGKLYRHLMLTGGD